ncbi:protein gp37 [Rhodococcus erythropolis]|nr:protein gp37 [Rhodococcus erythropolis]MCW2425470.1 protein gp37 [Rhodococcus erythropolis]
MDPVTGRDRVAAGCDQCYALAPARRLKSMGVEKCQANGNPVTSRFGFGVTFHPFILSPALKWEKPRMVSVNSMSDLFHPKVTIEFVRDIFDIVRDTPQHTYLSSKARDQYPASKSEKCEESLCL